MRTLSLLAAFCLLTLVLVATPASAIPPVCQQETVDGGVVKVTVGYGGGTGCYGASVERCTLYSDPEYPSHPTWRCERVP